MGAPLAQRPDYMSVPLSKEVKRILAIPRRPIDLENYLDATSEYRAPFEHSTMSLRPIQSIALVEASRMDGLFANMGVGSGKTLVTLLLWDAMGSDKAVLLLPSQLRGQLFRKMIPEYEQHFQLPPIHVYTPGQTEFPKGLYVVSYEDLSSPRRADVLERIDPDLVICDEAHKLKHRRSVRTRRFMHFFQRHPEVRLCVLSGTMTSKSVLEYFHLLDLTLKKNAPCPNHWRDQTDWSNVLDAQPRNPMEAGALLLFCKPGEEVRSGFRRRLVETMGVVATVDTSIGTSLLIRARGLEVPKRLEDFMRKVRITQSIEDEHFTGGNSEADGFAYWRAMNQLSCGFYYRWVWPGGKKDPEWIEARKEWHKEIRAFLKNPLRPGLDSPFLYTQAVIRGELQSTAWEAWNKVRDRKAPPVETVWINDFLVRDAVEWGRMSEGGGIIWYEHRALGAEIARVGNFPLYDADRDPTTATEKVIVASIKAHYEGKNLQRYANALVTTPPPGGALWEQLLGRLHRPGQEADEVTFDWYAHTLEMQDSFVNAITKAKYIQETQGNVQRLCYASFIDPPWWADINKDRIKKGSEQ